MIDHIEVLEAFIRETGQERGEISGEMALASLNFLKESIEKTIRANEYMYARLRDEAELEIYLHHAANERIRKLRNWARGLPEPYITQFFNVLANGKPEP